MKKLLLFTSVVIASIGLNAQTLLTDNFTGLTVGNVGTDITGAAAGQGGLFTFVSGGANSDFQIVNEGGVYGNVVQINGSATATGTRFMWKADTNANWPTRTAGNNIIEVEYEFFTGAPSTSKNSPRVYIYDAAGTKVLAGLSMAFDTKIISGVGYYNNAGTLNNFSFNLGAAGATLALTPNTWVKVGMSFNKTTGEVKWKGPGINGFIMGAATGLDPDEIDYLMGAGTGNTVSASVKFDNLVARASNSDTLLGNETFKLSSNIFAVYPNPANDFINISNSENIQVSNIKITDLNGRVVKQSNFDNVSNINLNVSDLSAGIYMMNINTNEGSTVKKIIKN